MIRRILAVVAVLFALVGGALAQSAYFQSLAGLTGPLAAGQVLGATSAGILGPVTIGGSLVNLSAGLRIARRTVASGSTDPVTSADITVNWNSASGSAKTETIPACASGNDGEFHIVADEYGDAGTNHIAVTPVSGTINKVSSYSINSNNASAQMTCDGSTTNWVVN